MFWQGCKSSYKRRNSYFFKIPPKISYFFLSPLNRLKWLLVTQKCQKLGGHWGAYSAPKPNPQAVRTRYAREHFLLFQLWRLASLVISFLPSLIADLLTQNGDFPCSRIISSDCFEGRLWDAWLGGRWCLGLWWHVSIAAVTTLSGFADVRYPANKHLLWHAQSWH